jgi:hypothetical protein
MMGMPTCREVMRVTTASTLDELPPMKRLGFRMHVMLCRHCRRYTRQIRAIGIAAREVLTRPSGERESLDRLRKALLGRLDQPEAD